MIYRFQKYDSPIGSLSLVAKGSSLYAVLYEGSWLKMKERISPLEEMGTPILRETRKQLDEYFQGGRKKFELPYELEGTDFQVRVWSALSEIPFGATRTYREQAVAINSPQAVRAVGRVNGMNLLSIVLPCHRVIGSNGALTGYAGGLAAKQYLLNLEGKK